MESFTITISNRQYKYILPIQNKVTIIRGDSATGKSLLYNLVSDYFRNQFGITVDTKYSLATPNIDLPSLVNSKERWEQLVLFFDEDSILLSDYQKSCLDDKTYFTEQLLSIDTAFVFITRDPLIIFPMSLHNVLKIVAPTNSNIFTFQPIIEKVHESINTDVGSVTIIEDSQSGCKFLQQYLDLKFIPIEDINKDIISTDKFITTSNGISNMAHSLTLLSQKGINKVNVIYDYVGAGFYGERIHNICNTCGYNILNWDSFEKYILDSDIISSHSTYSKINSLGIYNLEKYYENCLSKELLNYNKKYTNTNCLNLNSACQTCYNHNYMCKYTLNNKKDLFLYDSLLQKNNFDDISVLPFGSEYL